MNRKLTGWAAFGTCALAAVAVANGGTTVLSDGFENDATGQFKTALTNFTATRGDVDVLAPGELGVSGRGQVIDLDGSSGVAARLESKQDFTLTPGTYNLSFDLAGSQRTYTDPLNTVVVALGNVFQTNITKNFDEPFTTLNFPITVTTTTTGRLIFDQVGGDNVGLLLDNVLLTNTTAPAAAVGVPVPLPAAAWTGLGTLGLIAAIGSLRRRVTTIV